MGPEHITIDHSAVSHELNIKAFKSILYIRSEAKTVHA
jgi:hypothetical protein